MPLPLPISAVVVHRGPQRNFMALTFAATHGFEIVAYIDNDSEPRRSESNGIPVIAFETWRERLRHLPSIVTALDCTMRRAMVERIVADGGALVRSRSTDKAVAPSVTFGEGTLSGDGPLFIASLTAIGRYVIIMPPASIGHDCVVGNFVTIYPTVAISGHVVIEDEVDIGVGAVIVNGSPAQALHIGRGAHIDAGAVVTKSVAPGAIVTGNPARTTGRSLHRPSDPR